jgi:ectoine hydroxylase-related dioxygenase (phytanoyl-CoA dioxygenase family)
MAPDPYRRVAERAQPLFDDLRRARGQRESGGREFDESRTCTSRSLHADLYEAVENALDASGLLAGVSEYLGRRAAIVDVNPQINDATDDFWRRTFPDLPPSERPLSYFHSDVSGAGLKAIIYLSDVEPENGPFCFAVGSHRVKTPMLIRWVEETNDQSGASSTTLEGRSSFAALPMILQRKCAFGNDVMPHTEIADRVLAAEWRITAARGHVVLFDPKGLHRGGMVTRGERRVLTCVFA